MENYSRITLEEFHNKIYNAASTELFMKNFRRHSEAGDRHAMIEMIMTMDEISNFEISSQYNEKNNDQAEKLFNELETIDGNSSEIMILKKIDILTKALFAVDPKDILFIEILTTRARYSFSIGFYSKCLKDCDFVLAKIPQFNFHNNDDLNKYKNMCILLKNQCKKFSGKRKLETILKLPKIDGKINRKLKNCSDIVSLNYDDNRGRHLIVNKNVKAGSVLIVDEPFSFSTDESALSTNCLHCHVSLQLNGNIRLPCENCQTVSFCSEKCRETAWSSYHKYECQIFNNFLENPKNCNKEIQQRSYLLLAYRTTVAKAVIKSTNTLEPEFLCYQDAKSPDSVKSLKIDINTDFYDALDYKTVYSLETHCEKAKPNLNLSRSIKSFYLAKCLVFVLSKIEDKIIKNTLGRNEFILLAVGILRNIQAVDCNAYEIVENIRDCNTKTYEPRNVGGAIYTTVSLVNHGCYPNIVRHSYPGGIVVVRTLRSIEKGDEIVDCYGPHFITDVFELRQQYLNDKYHFKCACEACNARWKFPFEDEIIFKCTLCSNSVDSKISKCKICLQKIDLKKINTIFGKSKKKRLAAIRKMVDGQYSDALILLLEHAFFIDNNIIAPTLEGIKTQQSIIQCYNSLSNIAPR